MILMSAVLLIDSLPLADHLVLLLMTLIIMSVLMAAWRLYSILSIAYYLLVILTVLALIGKTATPPPPHDEVQDLIMDLFISNGFAQYVKHPTRQIIL